MMHWNCWGFLRAVWRFILLWFFLTVVDILVYRDWKRKFISMNDCQIEMDGMIIKIVIRISLYCLYNESEIKFIRCSAFLVSNINQNKLFLNFRKIQMRKITSAVPHQRQALSLLSSTSYKTL
jgi:hypothetical protein